MENLPATPPATPPLLPLETFAAALGDATRWRIVTALAEGQPLMVSELAVRIGRSPDLTSKHLARLRKAGVVEQVRGRLYRIPPAYLQTPGLVDFGHCQISAAVRPN